VPRAAWTDADLDQLLGNLLRAGVLISAFVVLLGGIYFLYQYGGRPMPDYSHFDPSESHPTFESLQGVPDPLRNLSGIVHAAARGHSRGLIQLGIVLLIATPIARVIFSVFAFAVERDYTYVVVTLIVLIVLLYSLLTGGSA
jgi:uncharacterized membrane protein